MLLLNKRRRWRRLGAAACVLIGIATGIILLDRAFPPDLSRYQATSTTVLARDGRLLHVFETGDGHWRLPVKAADVDPLYVQMLCAYEDQRFYHHPGVDPLALGRAIGQMIVHGHVVSGGSTLTMQVARLLEPHRRTVGGKLFEIARALQLEAHYSKAEILGMYLTLAPFGGNLDGVRAATLAYFGKEPQQLSQSEAALLVALPQSPTRRRPDRHPVATTAARAKVLGLVSQRQDLPVANSDYATPVPLVRHGFPAAAPHFSRQLAAGMDSEIIPSTIDADLQHQLEERLADELAGTDPHVNGAVLVIDNASHEILASVGGRSLQGPGGYLDLTRTMRSPGSTLKPFIYGLAFDELIVHPETLIEDTTLQFNGYAPRNFDRTSHGLVTVREALQQSLNIPAVEVMQRVGPGRFAGAMTAAGATLKFPKGNADPGLAIALGGVGISLRDLAMLYTGLANSGMVAPLVARHDASPKTGCSFVSPVSAWYLRTILTNAPLPDGVISPSLTAQTGNPQAGIAVKTGTSYGFRDAWAFGYSSARTVGVWIGRVEGTPRPGFYGRNTAAPFLFKIFEAMPGANAGQAGPPAGALIVNDNAQLPLALRRFNQPKRLEAATGPKILYPPAASVLDLIPDDKNGWQPITIAAEGGSGNLRFFINNAPVGLSAGNKFSWLPDGPGFTKVTVVDDQDRQATSVFRLKRTE